MGPDPVYLDARGTAHRRAVPDARIACLVPSITELVCDLGLAAQLVARTGFCIHPRALLGDIPKVGGTKDVDLERLRALAPTHVIVNIDENRKPVVDEIARFVPHVIVTHPNAPQDNLALYRLVGGVFDRDAAAEKMCNAMEVALGAALQAATAWPRENVLYLIWKDPWMTVARDTYISRTLAVVGWDTVPGAASARYPEVDLAEAAGEAPVILLSSEPYRFRMPHLQALQAELDRRVPGRRVALIDGEMASWYGSRAIRGLRYLAKFRAACYNSPLGTVGQTA
jgi:ABC-type Fe3+-hydroxamate transport system substrate-binding protein